MQIFNASDENNIKETELSTVDAKPQTDRIKRFFSGCYHYLTHIHQIPWFSFLLVGLLGYGTYQTLTHASFAENTVVKRSIKILEKKIYRVIRFYQQRRFIPNKTKPLTTERNISSVDIAPLSESLLEPNQLMLLEQQKTTMESEIIELKATIAQMKLDYAELEQTLKEHEKREEAMQNSRLSLDSSPSVEEVSASSTEMYGIDYTVHAVVPGRAWLSNSAGGIVTVSLGSPLSLLGKVQYIDIENRLVYFDSETVIGPPLSDL